MSLALAKTRTKPLYPHAPTGVTFLTPWVVALSLLCVCALSAAQQPSADASPVPVSPQELETTADWNRRLQDLLREAEPATAAVPQEYRIGPEDLLEITVFEAPELNRSARVSASGEISLPLVGAVKAAGLTPREFEFVLQELLRRSYMKDPHVGVFVREMQSHSVSVFGAVEKPGVFQIRGTKTLLEVLSMAEGLADDAGDTVLVMRGASFVGLETHSRASINAPQGTSGAEQVSAPVGPRSNPAAEVPSAPPPLTDVGDQGSLEIDLKALLESGDPHYNVPVFPGDIVKVTRAGIVYVVGEVKKPGGFVLKSNENISVLQAIALAEGLDRTAAKSKSRIIRTNVQTGERTEIPIDVGKVLSGKETDLMLQPKDIVFVPTSGTKAGLYRGLEAVISVVGGVIVYR